MLLKNHTHAREDDGRRIGEGFSHEEACFEAPRALDRLRDEAGPIPSIALQHTRALKEALCRLDATPARCRTIPFPEIDVSAPELRRSAHRQEARSGQLAQAHLRCPALRNRNAKTPSHALKGIFSSRRKLSDLAKDTIRLLVGKIGVARCRRPRSTDPPRAPAQRPLFVRIRRAELRDSA